ncbi:MAG: hypothetical protein LBR93_04140, partial [Treponema sp.]|nr:hypothetical protein [Treponema sp.]
MYKPHSDFSPHRPVGFARLQELMDQPVLDASALKDPVIVDSFSMYREGKDWFLQVRGTNGEEGRAPCSPQAEYFFPIAQKKILPGFLGKDARELEKIFREIWVSDLNYKIQGLAWWCCVAWTEAVLLDMLARAAGLNVADLLGGRRRDEVE